MKEYVIINGEKMNLFNVVISEVKVCRGVRYVHMSERFEDMMGWGFEIISDEKRAFSVVQASRFLAKAFREKFMEDLRLAKSGDKLFC